MNLKNNMILKVIKIKPWMIKFKINDQIYFIRESAESSHSYALWKYDPTDNKGHYKVECLESAYGNLRISDFVPIKRGQTYRGIDSYKFLMALAYKGFGKAVGMCEEDIDKLKYEARIIWLENKIVELYENIARLEEERAKTISVLKHQLEFYEWIENGGNIQEYIKWRENGGDAHEFFKRLNDKEDI